MMGADIVYYEVSSNQVTDAFALDFVAPTPDFKQDWTLTSASNLNRVLTVEAFRLLYTMDPQDTKITNDSWPAIDGTRVIAAWGDSAYIEYHGARAPQTASRAKSASSARRPPIRSRPSRPTRPSSPSKWFSSTSPSPPAPPPTPTAARPSAAPGAARSRGTVTCRTSLTTTWWPSSTSRTPPAQATSPLSFKSP